jgi:hypothetical protein
MPKIPVITKLETDTKTVTYLETTPTTPTVDKFLVAKLLASKPPAAPDLERVVVRCDRNTGQWQVISRNGQVIRSFARGIMTEVEFSTKYRPAAGCGVGHHVGMATGKILPAETPVSVPARMVHRIGFDDGEGEFFFYQDCKDPDKCQALLAADYLILKDDCHSEVLINPKKKTK